jgi:hypothetical protein
VKRLIISPRDEKCIRLAQCIVRIGAKRQTRRSNQQRQHKHRLRDPDGLKTTHDVTVCLQLLLDFATKLQLFS